jgi:hypothetical protein
VCVRPGTGLSRSAGADPAHCKTENPGPMVHGLGSKGYRPCRVSRSVQLTLGRVGRLCSNLSQRDDRSLARACAAIRRWQPFARNTPTRSMNSDPSDPIQKSLRINGREA